jgi:DNA mismatch endonuclease (patch repair protein)
MTDILSKQARSERMSRVRQKDTAPELALRKRLHAAGFRYVLHSSALPGRPDLAFPMYRAAVFVHGCFWHGHDCRAGRAPSSNTQYWAEKIAANQERDQRKTAELEEHGWRVMTVWECETKPRELEKTVAKLIEQICVRNAPSS